LTTERRARGDRGQVGGIEAIPFGLLIFVGGALLIANAWAVVDAKFATDAAAHQAARAFVEAPHPDAALDAAVEAGRAAIAGHGRDPDRGVVEAVGPTTFERCSRARFAVTYEVPAITIPFIGGFGGGFHVRSEATELVDPFRADVPGEVAACD
jgi:hypothetical protein